MRVCSKCGKHAGDQGNFCSFCGGPLALVETDHLREMSEGETTPKDDVRSAIESRKATDVRLSSAWAAISLLILVPTTGYICVLIIQQFMFVLGFNAHIWNLSVISALSVPIGTVLFGCLFGLLTYKMLSRLNRHIDREERLRAALMSYVRSEARKSGGEQGIVDDLLKLSAFDGQATTYEKKLDPRRWGWGVFLVYVSGPLALGVYFLVVIATIGGYDSDHDIYYLAVISMISSIILILVTALSLVTTLILTSHLMRTIATHEQRWYGFAGSFQAAMSLASKDIEMPVPERPLKERSTILYVGLTIVTLGIFAIYWLYVLIKDPNAHFEHQRRTEDAILAAL